MTIYRQLIFSVASTLLFGSLAIAQQLQTKYYVVANTTPPDAFLALRTDPSPKIGRRIEMMPNGTALEVLKRNPDGWWYVRVVVSGHEGWALSSQKDKRWIVCCADSVTTTTTNITKPATKSATDLTNATNKKIDPPHAAANPSFKDAAPFSYNPVILELTPDGTVGFNPELIVNRCLRETGAKPGFMNEPGGAELLQCIDREQTKQAYQLGDRACSDSFCIYRLKQVAENTFSGGGYTLKHHVSSKHRKFGNQDLTDYESVLTRDDGKRAIMSQTIGPVGSIFFSRDTTSRPKSEITAKYYGPMGVGNDGFVILRVPRERVASGEDKKAEVASLPCRPAPTDSVPCMLKWKTIEFKFEAISRIGSFRMDGTEKTVPQNRVELKKLQYEKITFSNNDDVFFFTQNDGGYLYKVNLELDFLANRSRAPKTDHLPCVKSSRGRMDLKNNILSWNRTSEGSCDWNNTFKIEYQIAFSQDFTSCSVAGFSLVDKDVDPKGSGYLLQTYRFEKSLDCRIYNAR